jgi:hypothetical protein
VEEETTPVEAEVTEEVEAQTEPENDTPNDDTNEAAEVTDTPAETTETSETTVPELPTEDDEDDAIINYQPQEYQPQMIDFNQLPQDEQGNVDPNAFAQALLSMQQQTLNQARAQARDEMMQVRQEEKLWQRAEKEFPQIAKNREMRQLVQNMRYGVIASGKNATPLEAARQIFKHIGSAQAAGQTQAKQSVQVQRSAALETSSTQSAPRSNSADLMSKISSSNRAESEAARQALLTQWIEDGTVKTR